MSRSTSMLILLWPPRLTPRSSAIHEFITASFLQRQCDGPSGCGRGASGVQNLGRNQVGFQRSQAVRLPAVEDYGAQFAERVVMRRGDVFRLDLPLLLRRTPHPHLVTSHRDDVTDR